MNKKTFFLFACTLLYLFSYSQKSKLQSFEKKQTLKDVFLCRCVNAAFPDDSLSIKDPSAFSLLGNINGSFEAIPIFDSLSRIVIEKATISRNGKHAESSSKPRLLSSCIKEYRSKNLDTVVDKLIKEYMSSDD